MTPAPAQTEIQVQTTWHCGLCASPLSVKGLPSSGAWVKTVFKSHEGELLIRAWEIVLLNSATDGLIDRT